MTRLSTRTAEIRAAMDQHSLAQSFQRAAFAALTAEAGYRADIVASDTATAVVRMFPDDATAHALLGVVEREAVTIDSSGAWESGTIAASLAFIKSLSGESATARIVARAAGSFPVDQAGNVLLPRRQAGVIHAPMVAEGDAIPVVSADLDSVKLPAPGKIGILAAFTRETMRKSFARSVVDLKLREAAAVSLDTAFFSAEETLAPGLAGALFEATDASSGISPEPRKTLATLARVVSTGGSGEVVFVTGTGRAAEIGVLIPELRGDVFGSPAVSDDKLIAVDPRSFAFGIGAADIFATREAVMHSDTAAGQIAEDGTPAAPVRSFFQTDSVGVRAILDMTWAARRTGSVAFVNGLAW